MLLAVSCFSQESFSLVENPDILSQEIKSQSDKTFSIRSDFEQRKHLSMLEETLISNGSFAYKKENDVKWQYSYPFNYTIVISNGKFLIDNEGKSSEFDINSNEMFKQINKMIVTAISGDFIGNDDFEVSFYKNEKYYLAELRPKDIFVEDMLKSINIYFSKDKFIVEKVKFVEPGDDFTLIIFKNREQNIKFSDNEFNIN